MAAAPAPAELYRVAPGATVRLADVDPRDTSAFPDRDEAEKGAADDIAAIDKLQDRLYAEGRQALLVVLQGMDASGKDGTIRKVFGPIDPLGVRASSFGKPTDEELAHDFLWRIHAKIPRKGEIAIFNRSHYEDVLVVRVAALAPAATVERRYEEINAFERLLVESGTRVVKVMLHISKKEQRERLQDRVDKPEKHWKHNPADLEARRRWDDYMAAYEIALSRCSTPWAPWFVVPGDRNWYRDAVVARLVRETLESMDPRYPEPDFDPDSITVV